MRKISFLYKFLFSQNAKTKKFLRTTEAFPIESYIKLLDYVDRPNPALSKEMRTSLTKSATILSVRNIFFQKKTKKKFLKFLSILFTGLIFK